MSTVEINELTEKMVEMTKVLRKVDTAIQPTDAEENAYNAMREAAYDMQYALTRVLGG